jgi:hypothetical protein
LLRKAQSPYRPRHWASNWACPFEGPGPSNRAYQFDGPGLTNWAFEGSTSRAVPAGQASGGHSRRIRAAAEESSHLQARAIRAGAIAAVHTRIHATPCLRLGQTESAVFGVLELAH